MAKTQPTGLYFMTPVWGESYTRLFLDIAIPCQLAHGNLPALRLPNRCQYLIFTTRRDAEVIISSSAYRALSKHIPVDIKFIESRIDAPHDTMSMCYRRGIALADDAGAASVFLTPDLAFSDGSFEAVQRLAAEGRRVVYISGLRTIKQPVASTLRAKYMAGEVIAVDPRSLMQIALEHLHPLAHSSFWEEGVNDLVPANLYWRVGSDGILARCFHLHPLFVFPERKRSTFYGTVDDDYVLASCPDPSMDFVCNDSDELLAVELSELGHHFLTGIPKGSIAEVVFWAEQYANRRHRLLIDVPIRLKADRTSDELWIEAERKSDRVVSEIHSLMKQGIFRLLFTGKWGKLERRASREALEMRIKIENAPKGLTEGRHSLRLSMPSISVLVLAFRALLLRCAVFSRALLLRCAVFLVRLYLKTMQKGSHVVPAVRELLLGPQWAPNPLSFSWLYVRQLSKDITDTLTKIGPDVLICVESRESIVARLASQHGAEKFGRLIDEEGLQDCGSHKTLCSLNTGLSVPSECLGGILIDAALRRCEDLGSTIHEATRVLKNGGWLAIKIDRIANPASTYPSEVLCTVKTLSNALRPQFEIVAHRFQGGIGTTLALTLAYYRRILINKRRIPFIVGLVLFLPLMPAEMIVAVILNVAGAILNRLDTTTQNYPSCIVIARKV